jgi:hypothetical protein
LINSCVLYLIYLVKNAIFVDFQTNKTDEVTLKLNTPAKVYLSIGLIFTLLIIAYFLFKTPKEDKIKPTLPNHYVNCNQLINATAPIEPSDIIKDKNDVQLVHARTNGLKRPFKTNGEFDSTYKKMVENYELVEVKDCRLYHVKNLKHSHPYLIPEAVSMIDEIAIRFQTKLKEKELGNYCFFLTSILRTEESQEKLSHHNGNASDTTAHFFATTVDISYKHFLNLDNDSIVPKWEIIQELTKTLLEMRKECKLLAVRERKQSCFHITVVCCKPED